MRVDGMWHKFEQSRDTEPRANTPPMSSYLSVGITESKDTFLLRESMKNIFQ